METPPEILCIVYGTEGFKGHPIMNIEASVFSTADENASTLVIELPGYGLPSGQP